MVQCGDVISVVDLRVVENVEAHLEMGVGYESNEKTYGKVIHER